MTTLREAAQRVISDLECLVGYAEKAGEGHTIAWLSVAEDIGEDAKKNIEALRAALAQPEPLPEKSKGALSHEENKQHNKKILDKFYEENAHLYTAPPQRGWQGLTDEEKLTIVRETDNPVDALAATEAKLKEKNGTS